MPEYDWNEVIKLNPQGYVEFNDGKRALHGPIESISIDDADMVCIKLKWAAQVALDEHGLPVSNEWEVAPSDDPYVFPNLMVPFVIEDTPEKGRRVRFKMLNILYIDKVEGLDPKRVKGLVVA